jgi:hypothetical protein
MRLAFAKLMRVAATSTAIPVTNPAVKEYANLALKALAPPYPLAPTRLRALQHRGENVKFAQLAKLNARKQYA